MDAQSADEALRGNQAGKARLSRETEGLLSSASVIDPRTIQAYLETEYRVRVEPVLTLRVGQANADLLAAHARHEAACSAFLTACNAFSEPVDRASNAARQAGLAEALSGRGLSFLPGFGQHPSGDWPGEDSFLVFGLTLAAAKVLGTQFEQNAFVWSGADGVPQLILLR